MVNKPADPAAEAMKAAAVDSAAGNDLEAEVAILQRQVADFGVDDDSELKKTAGEDHRDDGKVQIYQRHLCGHEWLGRGVFTRRS